jgi:hypothetical protein
VATWPFPVCGTERYVASKNRVIDDFMRFPARS